MANEDYAAQIKRLIGGNQLDIGPTGIISADEVHWLQHTSFTIAAGSTANVKSVSVQLQDGAHTAIDGARTFFFNIYGTSTATDLMAATTLMAITTGTAGDVCNINHTTRTDAPTALIGISSTAGLLNFNWTDTGHSSGWVGVVLPGGLLDLSASIRTTSS